MPAFEVVAHPVFSPTRCATCGTSSCPDGFVDLLVDSAPVRGFTEDGGDPIHDPDGVEPTLGHLYMCVQCVAQAAVKIGGCDRADRVRLEDKVVGYEAHIAELEQQLEAERLDKVVSLDDVRTLLATHEPGRVGAKEPGRKR